MKRLLMRTKKMYAELFGNPRRLFPTCDTTLFPNGEPEIWISSPDKKEGFRIRASHGPAGLSLTIGRFVGGAPLTVTGNLDNGELSKADQRDFYEVTICQYHGDEHSQAFKAWYGDPDANPHPGDRPAEILQS